MSGGRVGVERDWKLGVHLLQDFVVSVWHLRATDRSLSDG